MRSVGHARDLLFKADRKKKKNSRAQRSLGSSHRYVINFFGSAANDSFQFDELRWKRATSLRSIMAEVR